MDFARGKIARCHFDILAGHAAAIVTHLNGDFAGTGGDDMDRQSTRVDSILDEFFDDGRRSFDYLSGIYKDMDSISASLNINREKSVESILIELRRKRKLEIGKCLKRF